MILTRWIEYDPNFFTDRNDVATLEGVHRVYLMIRSICLYRKSNGERCRRQSGVDTKTFGGKTKAAAHRKLYAFVRRGDVHRARTWGSEASP